jgi:hypothetical protein
MKRIHRWILMSITSPGNQTEMSRWLWLSKRSASYEECNPRVRETADKVLKFIISIDMTILTATLPVSASRSKSSEHDADNAIRRSPKLLTPPRSSLSG